MRVTLIDFTLSRLRTPGGQLAFCDLAADPEVFAGPRGDVQAEAYRRMQRLTHGDWALHTPATNAVWLHYLADICLHQKLGPTSALTPAERHALRGFRKRALAYGGAADLVWDDYFAGAWAALAPP